MEPNSSPSQADIPVATSAPITTTVSPNTETLKPEDTTTNSDTVPMTVSPAEAVTYAGFWQRFLAGIIDGITISIITFIVAFPLSLVSGLVSPSSITSDNAGVKMISNAVSFIISACYAVLLIGKKGQTLGKMAMGIMVVKKDNRQTPGYITAFLREEIGKLLSFIPFCLGYLWVIWDKDKQAWHDKIAGTIVIKTKS
jgi:uncharacterized RDD family membrane protein YckC